ncbi:MAG TPA: hypothetical protein VI111_09180 [Thermoleophilaceae bacterium]
MFFQRVLKGIPAETATEPGFTDTRAQGAVEGRGVPCNWWLNPPDRCISPPEIQQKLTESALHDHLVNYDRVRTTTPFISTTAGTVERDAANARNVFFPPMYTALRFATRNFTQDGYVVHAYVYTLGKKSIELEEFAEEVRDVNTYTQYYKWHPEGEIVAKILIPARRIEKIERYDVAGLETELDREVVPQATRVFEDPSVYRDPLRYANIRGFPGAP